MHLRYLIIKGMQIQCEVFPKDFHKVTQFDPIIEYHELVQKLLFCDLG